MRWQTKLGAVAAIVVAAAAVWAGLALREASGALERGRETVAQAGRFAFERRAWQPPASGFEMLPARQDLRDAAWFAGSLWLAGSGGLGRYAAGGGLERQWLVGSDLPAAPLTALAVGLDPRESKPALFASTAGEGLLIVREDGAFEQVHSEAQQARDIVALLPLADGRLLLGTQQAGVLVYDASGLSVLHEELGAGHVIALAGEPEEIWIATLDRGLVRFRAGAIERFGEQQGLPDRRLLSLAAAGGSVYAGTAVGIAELEDGELKRTLGEGFFASALWADGSELSIGTLEEGVATVPLGRTRVGGAERPLAEGPSGVRRLVEFQDELFAVTSDALWRREGDGAWRIAVEPPGNELRDRNVSALHVDRSGRLWVGYFDRGLDLLDGGRLVAHVEDDVIYCVNRIVEDESKSLMAVATANGLAFLDSAGRRRQTLRKSDGLMADHVTDLAFQENGWVAAAPTGLTFFDAAGLRGLYALHGLVNNHVYTLAARGATVLAGTLGGLSVLEGGVVRQSFTTANSPLGHNWISALAGFRGDWFVGTYGAGVAKLTSDGALSSFEGMAGIEINPNAMTVSADHVYAGALEGGLLVYSPEDERWSAVTQGLPSANITALAYAGGTLYVGTDNGLARIAEESLSLP